MKKTFQSSLKLVDKRKKLIGAMAVGCLLAWGIHETEFWAGRWGLKEDTIAVITIEKEEDSQEGFPRTITVVAPNKSIWDGLGLVGVPLALLLLGWWFQKSQQEQAERLSKEQREQDASETREEVLQLYFDRISALLIDNNLMTVAANDLDELIDTKQGELLNVAVNVIKARTLSILRRFEKDLERKSSVIRFLAEADVTNRLQVNLSGINLSFTDLVGIELRNAHLNEADLSGAHLSKADLSGAHLNGANLSGSHLNEADLSGAHLSKADLSGAHLNGAKLSAADLRAIDLSRAHLNGAHLNEANLTGACLSKASLGSANLSRAILAFADLRKSFLRRVDLSEANLQGADLSEANLQGAFMGGADLGGSNLQGANLSKAKNLTETQLEEAFLCQTRLSIDMNLDLNRDCERFGIKPPQTTPPPAANADTTSPNAA